MTVTDPDPDPPPRPYHHGDLREALLAAAEAELAERGIEGFSLRGVAKRAGVSHAAPAHHFGDARGLLTALAADGFTRFLDTQRAARGAGAAGPARPHRRRRPRLHRLRHRPSGAVPADVRLRAARLRRPRAPGAPRAAFDHLLDNVAELRGTAGSGTDTRDDPAAMTDATAAWAMVHGLADLLQAGRLTYLRSLAPAEREAVMAGIIRRCVGPAPERGAP